MPSHHGVAPYLRWGRACHRPYGIVPHPRRGRACPTLVLRQKKAHAGRAKNTGSNVSNVVLFSGRATGEAQGNNNHSQSCL